MPSLCECLLRFSVRGDKLTVEFGVGDLRLRKPLLVPRTGPSNGLFAAPNFSTPCPQQNYTLPGLPDIDDSPLRGFITKVEPSEDCESDDVPFPRKSTEKIFSCLYLNVFRPAGISADAKLPVVVYIYGGGFATGDASLFDDTTHVSRSVERLRFLGRQGN
jgi:acetylcholinesterase